MVTGGAADIGAAVTTVLAERGVSAVAVDIDEQAGVAIARTNPERMVFLNGDVSKESVAKQAVELAVAKFGKLTALVNNAHASRQKPLMELTETDWALSFGTCLNATASNDQPTTTQFSCECCEWPAAEGFRFEGGGLGGRVTPRGHLAATDTRPWRS